MEKKKKFSVIKNLDIIIAGTAFVILVIITFGGVLMRYVFGRPFVWEEEVQVSLFIWVAFFGGAAAFRTHGHVQISMIYDVLPEKAKKILSVLVYLTVVFCLGYLFFKSSSMVMMFFETKKLTPVLSIPFSYVYGIIPVCCILMIINYTLDSVAAFKKVFSKTCKKGGKK